MTRLEKLYREVALEVEMPFAEVEQLHRFQFLFSAAELASGQMTSIRWPYLGALQPIPHRVESAAAAKIKKNFHAFGFHCC